MSAGRPSPWDIEQYRPGIDRTAGLPRASTPGDEPLVLADGRRVRLAYESDGTPLVLLALWTALLTVVTLGLYRFWMVTRLRRHYWRAVRLEGDPFEYTGRGIEKLLGFFLALVVLAIYLGLVNLALTFVGLSWFDGNQFALQLSALSALPFLFFARYRARRYMLARTRWRGIRFGMEDGAWAYALRAVLYYALAILTLGLLYPMAHFRLSKFMTDRSWFGDARFEQHGSWRGIFAAWAWLYVVALLVGLALWGVVERPDDLSSILFGALMTFGGIIATLVLFLFYQVTAFRYFWENMTLGKTRFENDISGSAVLGIYIGGTFLASLASLIVAGVLVVGGAWAMATLLSPEQLEAVLTALGGDFSGPLPAWPILAVGALFYLVFFASSYAFTQVFITRPVIRRMATGMTVIDPQFLSLTRQRAHDEAAEAGGFADALGVDVGAGF